MKSMIFLVCACSILLFCKKNTSPINTIEPTPDPIDTTVTIIDTIKPIIEFGRSSMLKNGVLWDLPIKAFFHNAKKDRFFISAKILDSSSYVQQSFRIQDIPCKTGGRGIEYSRIFTFNNYIPEGFLGMTFELDQPIGSFQPDTTRNDHYLEVIKYDSIAQTVEGKFQIFMGKLPSPNHFSGVPDSIFITEGKFNLKIEEQ